MLPESDTPALVALLRGGGRSARRRALDALATGSVLAELEADQGLLAGEARERAAREIAAWHERGIDVISAADTDYPENLRGLADRPPLLFRAGRMTQADSRSIAVIGSRRATARGAGAAAAIAARLVADGFTVLSGLAAGIDTAAHVAALESGGRTVAVIGTGLDRCYPPQNAGLQRAIAARCAVVSQFWPESPRAARAFRCATRSCPASPSRR